MQENVQNHRSPEGSSNRVFGLVFAILFCVIALQPMLHGNGLRVYAAWLSASILVVSIITPNILAPLNRLWAKFGLFLHGIVSPVALGILFFGLITPMAIFMRIAGKDPLRRKFDRDSASYWIQRDLPSPEPDSMKNQF